MGYEGAYSSANNYGLNDVVSLQGSSWISLQAVNHGNTPGQSPAAWTVLAAAGVGTPGASGPAGPAGVLGPMGPTGASGSAGVSGAAGANGAPGLPGLVYQGAYASASNYALGDVVLWQGSSYASLISGNHGNTPGLSPGQWGLLTAQGTAGPVGAAGATGATGATGALGPVGPPGERGDQGAQGSAGQAGAQGLTGPKGDAGLSGPAGPQGAAGPVGLAFKGGYSSSVNYGVGDGVQYGGAGYVSLVAGNHGNTPDQSPTQWTQFAAAGSAGAVGVTGPAGNIGAAGPVGPVGSRGATGTTGATGPQGPAVANYLGNYASFVNYAAADAVSLGGSTYISLVGANHGNTPGVSPAYWAVLAAQGDAGAPGVAGVPGAAGAPGPAGPAGATGPQGAPIAFAGLWSNTRSYVVGDAVGFGGASYIATSPSLGRQPDGSPAFWGVLSAQGTQGPAGAQGLAGPFGARGDNGSPGIQGAAGQAGAQGLSGPKGDPGASGPAGPQGVAGPVGLAPRGAYSSTANYAVGDGITYGGSGYVSLVGGNHGNSPDVSSSAWSLFAAAGAPGATGPAGPVGAAGALGTQGAAGVPGAVGPQGTSGAQGPAALTYTGNYNSATSYGVADAVSFGGSTFVSLLGANHGNTPGQSPTAWAVLAAQGAAGPAGAAGVAGVAGVSGPSGPAGLTGPQGPPISYTGTWNSGAAYVVGAAVNYNGASYIATTASAGQRPDISPAAWGVLSAQGLQGPVGAQGPAGQQGPKGDTGAQGLQGLAGQAGAQGVTGVAGPTGVAGFTGAAGPQGPVGLSFAGTYSSTATYAIGDGVQFGGSGYVSRLTGNRGNTPDQSPAAWTLFAQAGSSGASGPMGPAGVAGATGPAGPTGAAGLAGAAGPTGPQGPPAVIYTGSYSPATSYAMADAVSFGGSTYVSLQSANRGNTPGQSATYWAVLAAQGATGPAGPIGTAGASGSPGPAGAAGAVGPQGPPVAFSGGWLTGTTYKIGDTVSYSGGSYIAMAANQGRQPDQSPQAWGVLAQSGAAGPAGPIGATGLQGPTGFPGPAGPTGAAGSQGTAGPAGIAGAIGPAGPVGSAGQAGAAGPAGLTYRGTYVSGTNYGLGDAATYLGSSYLSTAAANAGNNPATSPAVWSLLAAQGSAGATGASGLNGANGTPGAVGPVGPAGASGAMGAVGATGLQGLVYQGTYAAGTSYAANDAVTYGGSAYLSLTSANHGNAPDLSTGQWGLLSGRGTAGATGVAGRDGAVGAAGATGAVGPQGPAVAFRGGWLAGSTYAVGDAVSYGGTSYIASAPNAGRQPDQTPQVWNVLAQAGAAGPAGASGATGLQGPTGFAGPAGATGAVGPAGATGTAGPVGVTGPAGPVGVAGLAGASGPAGLIYRGTYASSTNYALNDAVTFQGGSYISLAPNNAGNTPGFAPNFWNVLSAQGAVGAQGAAGPAGVAGPAGPAGMQGLQGITGPAGTTGAVGASGPAGPQGAAGPIGAAGINFRGAWVAGTRYSTSDAVTYSGGSYLAQAGSTSVQPDSNAAIWALLAASGGAGPTGAAGTAASVQVGTVTTGAAGSSASVVNSGTGSAAMLNFTIPQGAAGVGGTGGSGGGGGGTSGVPYHAMYHAVSFAANFYSVNNTNQSASETSAVLTYVPDGCSATRLVVYSQQAATVTATLRVGTPGAMADSALSCQVATGQRCTATGTVAVPAGGFVDIGITHSDSNPSGVWVAVSCN